VRRRVARPTPRFDATIALAFHTCHLARFHPAALRISWTQPRASGQALLLAHRGSHQAETTAQGLRQQQRPAACRGSTRRTAVVLADDRFDRGDGPEPAIAQATSESRGSSRPSAGRTIAFAAAGLRRSRRARAIPRRRSSLARTRFHARTRLRATSSSRSARTAGKPAVEVVISVLARRDRPRAHELGETLAGGSLTNRGHERRAAARLRGLRSYRRGR
jgi:hypothetical protein